MYPAAGWAVFVSKEPILSPYGGALTAHARAASLSHAPALLLRLQNHWFPGVPPRFALCGVMRMSRFASSLVGSCGRRGLDFAVLSVMLRGALMPSYTTHPGW